MSAVLEQRSPGRCSRMRDAAGPRRAEETHNAAKLRSAARPAVESHTAALPDNTFCGRPLNLPCRTAETITLDRCFISPRAEPVVHGGRAANGVRSATLLSHPTGV